MSLKKSLYRYVSGIQCAYVIYVVICVLCGCTIFFQHCIIKGTIFGGKNIVEHVTCVLVFSTNFSATVFIRIRTERDIININTSSCQVRVVCPILVKLEFSGQIFEKYSNIKFHKNPASGSRDFPC
jgi:hypothetical protein